jgi:hypothetical protein
VVYDVIAGAGGRGIGSWHLPWGVASYLRDQKVERVLAKAFGEDVGKILGSDDPSHLQLAVAHEIPDLVVFDAYMPVAWCNGGLGRP